MTFPPESNTPLLAMHIQRRALLASIVMLSGAAGAHFLTPRKRRVDILGTLNLEQAIPTSFGEWRIDTQTGNQIVDPQTQATIAAAYTQTLSRIYVNLRGDRIMLSLAYGEELSDTGVGLHYPEVCYPAQGFKVNSNVPVLLRLSSGTIKARRLETSYGDARFEPVTYWTMIGERTEYAGLDRKLAEIRQGLAGMRPDGLLFRISNISRQSQSSFALHESFTSALLIAVSPDQRWRLSGLQ